MKPLNPGQGAARAEGAGHFAKRDFREHLVEELIATPLHIAMLYPCYASTPRANERRGTNGSL